jgi:hypothetical protein
MTQFCKGGIKQCLQNLLTLLKKLWMDGINI